MSSNDFMPLDGWDHLELWVGNAKQAAYFYEHAFGFTRTAYAGPETGVRDRASYVLEQGDIRLVLTSGLRADSEIGAVRLPPRRRREGHRAPGARARREAYRQAVQRGARGIGEPHWVEDELRPRRARVDRDLRRRRSTRSSTAASYAGPYLPGYRRATENGHAARASA